MSTRHMNAGVLTISLLFSADLATTRTRAQSEDDQRFQHFSQQIKDDPCFGMPRDAAIVCHPLDPLTLNELQTLHDPDLETKYPSIHQKMKRRIETAVIRNFNQRIPDDKIKTGLLRVVEFNLERFYQFDAMKAFFSDCDEFIAKYTKVSARTLSSDKREKLCKAVGADFYLLNEADAGICRSGYRSAEELAMRLNLNIAQAMEWFEVRPTIVGLQDGEPGCRVSEVNPQLARNEQFNALLSRYPIRHARRIELKACHDWYADERALGGQLRRGTRSALIAEVDIPGSDPGTIVLVVTHLENKSFLPTCRNEQFLQINAALQKMTEERGGKELPVVMGGDMNSVFGSEFFFMKPYFKKLGFDTSDKFIGTFGFQTLDFILTRPTKALPCLRVRNEGIVREVAPGDVRSLLKNRLSDHAPLVADFAVRCGK